MFKQFFHSLKFLLFFREPKAQVSGHCAIEIKVMNDVCTSLWRARKKMMAQNDGSTQMRISLRHLETTWDALNRADIEIIDNVGAEYDRGMALKVIAFEQASAIKRDEIIETIKPTIYYGEKLVQIGEVIVGMPAIDTSHDLGTIEDA